MDNRKKMLDRARKLFNMAHNAGVGAEAEAEIAMRRLSNMMDEFGFTKDELSKAENHIFGDVEAGKVYNSPLPKWYTALAGAAANITDTVDYTNQHGKRRVVKFRGMNNDEQLAIMMFDYLLDAQARGLKAYKKETGTSGTDVIFAFRIGFAIQMWERSNEIKEARNAKQQAASTTGQSLILIKNQLITNHFSPLTESKRKSRPTTVSDASALAAGRSAADNVSLNKQVHGSAPTVRLTS